MKNVIFATLASAVLATACGAPSMVGPDLATTPAASLTSNDTSSVAAEAKPAPVPSCKQVTTLVLEVTYYQRLTANVRAHYLTGRGAEAFGCDAPTWLTNGKLSPRKDPFVVDIRGASNSKFFVQADGMNATTAQQSLSF